jgi:hypothetical protein
LYRHWIDGAAKGSGFASDYAATILALLAVHRLEPKQHYLHTAQELTEKLIDGFWDDAGKGFFFTASDQETLVVRPKEYYDGAVPSANSLATQALVELSVHTETPRYREMCSAIFAANPRRLQESAVNSPALLRALGQYLAVTAQESVNATVGKGAPPAGSKQVQPIQKITVTPAKLQFTAGKPADFEVRISLAEPWHINANPAEPKFLRPTLIKFSDASAVELDSVRYPTGKPYAIEGIDEKVMVYEGGVVIRATAKPKVSAAGGTLTLEVHYQACDDKRCLAPAKKTIEVEFTIAP